MFKLVIQAFQAQLKLKFKLFRLLGRTLIECEKLDFVLEHNTNLHIGLLTGVLISWGFFFRRSKEIVENPARLCGLRKTFCLCHDYETSSRDAHGRKTIFLQSLWKAVHSKGQPEGKCEA